VAIARPSGCVLRAEGRGTGSGHACELSTVEPRSVQAATDAAKLTAARLTHFVWGSTLSAELAVRRGVVSLLAVALLLAPTTSSYAMGRGGHGGGHGGHGFHGHGVPGHGFPGHGFAGHGFRGHHGLHGHHRFHGRGGVIVVGPGCCWGPWG